MHDGGGGEEVQALGDAVTPLEQQARVVLALQVACDSLYDSLYNSLVTAYLARSSDTTRTGPCAPPGTA